MILQFEAEKLYSAVLDLQKDRFSGVAYIKSTGTPKDYQDSNILAFRNGEITYGGTHLPHPEELLNELGQNLKLKIMDEALEVVKRKVENPDSVREYVKFLVRFNLFKWQDIEKFCCNNVVRIFEKLSPYAGSLELETSAKFDLCYGSDGHGLAWDRLMQDITLRQQEWDALSPTIPSMHAIPRRPKQLEDNGVDLQIKQHLQEWVNGQKSVLIIATQIGADPLKLAQTYFHWSKQGLITFNDEITVSNSKDANTPKQNLPNILSVDDSPIVQTMIKRAIDDRYNVLLADNAVKALNLLNTNEIELLLLDVTMPDIDGLELCRTIRSISKFRDLPVIMLTAKDGMFNKLKGQMAGSTHYLTKPIEREKLLEVLEKYIPTQVTS